MMEISPDEYYRPLVIGCIANSLTELQFFFNNFTLDNLDSIAKIVNDRSKKIVILKDNDKLIFVSAKNSTDLRGYRFDQIFLYNMIPNQFPNILALLDRSYLPEEYQKFQVLEYLEFNEG